MVAHVAWLCRREAVVGAQVRRALVRLADSADHQVETVFHRAFDITARPEYALEQLVDLGITRTLASTGDTRMAGPAGKAEYLVPSLRSGSLSRM